MKAIVISLATLIIVGLGCAEGVPIADTASEQAALVKMGQVSRGDETAPEWTVTDEIHYWRAQASHSANALSKAQAAHLELEYQLAEAARQRRELESQLAESQTARRELESQLAESQTALTTARDNMNTYLINGATSSAEQGEILAQCERDNEDAQILIFVLREQIAELASR